MVSIEVVFIRCLLSGFLFLSFSISALNRFLMSGQGQTLYSLFLMTGPDGEILSRPQPNTITNSSGEKSSEGNAAQTGFRKFGRLFQPSTSAQDLRCFEMEKEKEDNSFPRGVIEACIRDLGNEAGPSKDYTSGSESEVHPPKPTAQSSWHGFFKHWKKGSMKRLPSFPPVTMSKTSRRKRISAREHIGTQEGIKSPWKNFTLAELRNATNNFSQENLIGKGGHAKVYKGCLPDGQLVAIKWLSKEEGEIGFLSELGIIAHIDHPNIAKLIGYGVEGGTYLVLQLSTLGSLGSLLYASRENLRWGVRYNIILGIADGLLYLHENGQKRIIHRDIKADNILLTDNFEPQICDFGLAKWLPKQWTYYNVSRSEGTFGYFAPEYFMHGVVDEKTDVFSFGVLLLELTTGRRAIDDSQKSLVLWAKPFLDGNDAKGLVDPSLGDNYCTEEMDHVLLTASLCIEQNPILRPCMSQVVILLRGGDGSKAGCSKEHRKRFLQRTYSEELLDAEEYNSTKYLTDINRHEQVALASLE